MRHVSAIVVLAVLTSSCGEPPAGVAPSVNAGCAQPERDTVTAELQRVMQKHDQYFPEVFMSYLPARLDERQVQWMAASWDAPRNGVLFLLDCDGKTIANLTVGAMSALKAGPVVAGGTFPTVEFKLGPGTALGSALTQVAVATITDGVIRILWKHVASEAASAPSLAIEYLDEFAWEYSGDGASIAVNGSRKVGRFGDSDHGWDAGTTQAFPSEKFCWDASVLRYERCI